MHSKAILAALTNLRVRMVRFLVIFSFVWPFLNANYFFPQAEFEVNFLPVLLAVVLAPEIFAADGIALVFLAGTLAVAAFWGSSDAVMRLAIGAVPCIFLLNFQEYCVQNRKELIPRSLAYRVLQLFVGFSVLQWVDFYVHSAIPGWVTDALTVLVPRYLGHPYDELGLRGVQGWASEPSGAGVVCLCFAIIAAHQDPKRRLRILLLLLILVLVNKSVYSMALVAILSLVYLASLQRRRYAVIGFVLLAAGVVFYVSTSARLDEVIQTMMLYGANPGFNIDFARINQIVFPLVAFPGIYKPFTVFGVEMQPMGLLPLLAGYGSIFGLALYLRLALFKSSLRNAQSFPVAVTMLFILSFIVPPDLTPAIVAFAYAATPKRGLSRKPSWYEKVMKKAQQAYATSGV
jgi:hypothetical protein